MRLSIVGLCGIGFCAALLAACSRQAYMPSGAEPSITTRRAASQLKVLQVFRDPPRGQNPIAPVVADSSGNLFGETTQGGKRTSGGGCGTVFELVASGSGYVEKTLHVFAERPRDGCGPSGGLSIDAKGAIYGTTALGGLGYSDGIVFKLTPSGSGYKYAVIYRFKDGNDGAWPVGGVLIASDGVLYGATQYGVANACPGNTEGCGTVYRLTPRGSRYTEKILHAFAGGKDGLLPGSGLVTDSTGALYGTTMDGGGYGSIGDGTVYKLTPSGRGYEESVIHAFGGTGDGAYPDAPVIVESNGDVDGTTLYGGSDDPDCTVEGYGGNCGLVFRLTPSGSSYDESFIYEFKGGSDGSQTQAPLLDVGGTFYGTTTDGKWGFPCGGECGTIFALRPSGKHYAHTVLYRLNTESGWYPRAGVILYNGALYGTTYFQGRKHYAGGTVFELTL